MMVVGVLRCEVLIPHAQSLKDKRSALKSVTEQLRGRFNVAVALLEANEKWQRGTIGVSALGDGRAEVEGTLNRVTDWLRLPRLVELIRAESEFL